MADNSELVPVALRRRCSANSKTAPHVCRALNSKQPNAKHWRRAKEQDDRRPTDTANGQQQWRQAEDIFLRRLERVAGESWPEAGRHLEPFVLTSVSKSTQSLPSSSSKISSKNCARIKQNSFNCSSSPSMGAISGEIGPKKRRATSEKHCRRPALLNRGARLSALLCLSVVAGAYVLGCAVGARAAAAAPPPRTNNEPSTSLSLPSFDSHQQQQQHHYHHDYHHRQQSPRRKISNHQTEREQEQARSGREPASQQQQQPRLHDEPSDSHECQRLSALWQHLSSFYPALASHLLRWRAADEADDQQQQRHLWRLLESAERQLQATANGTRAATSKQANWLARVSSNPNYARLLAHLRAKQQQQQQQQLANGLQASDSQNAQSAQQVSYGRVAQYPHELAEDEQAARRLADDDQELASADASASERGLSAAWTLDKLRLLSQRTQRLRQQQQQQQRVASQAAAELQSNQIGGEPPSVASGASLEAQLDKLAPHKWSPESSRSAAHSARQTYVYGKVLHWPSQGQPAARLAADEANHQSGRASQTLDNLRELASGGAHSSTAGRPQAPSFGTVVAEPAQLNALRAAAAAAAASAASQQVLASFQAMDSDDNNELVGQQRAPSALVPDGGEPTVLLQQAAAAAATPDDFEGHFHAGPLKQVAVRQLRAPGDPDSDSSRRPLVELVGGQQLASTENRHREEAASGNTFGSAAAARDAFIVD